MNNFELDKLIKELWTQIEAAKKKFQGIYILDPEKYRKFTKVYTFMCEYANEVGGKVKYCDTRPESVHADLAVEVPILDLYKTGLEEFREVISYVDVFNVTPKTNGRILVEFSLSYLWKAVPKDE